MNTKFGDDLREHELEITHASWLSVCATFFFYNKTHLSHQREICLEREKQLDEWRNFAVDLHIYKWHRLVVVVVVAPIYIRSVFHEMISHEWAVEYAALEGINACTRRS